MANNADIVIRVRASGLSETTRAMKTLEEAGVRVEAVNDSLANSLRKTAQSGEVLSKALTGIYTVMSVGTITSYISQLGMLSDAWTNMTNKLANANSAQEDMSVIQERVFDIAQRTRTDLDATSTLYARLERSLSQYGVTGKQVASITETINKSMIVSGATSAEATAAIIQFSQGLQSGVLRGDEFRSVMEQAPRLGKMIADGLGVGTAGLREMANAGQLTADVVINSISKASSTIDEEFNRTTASFQQRLTVATNELQRFAGTSASVQGVVKAMAVSVEYLAEHLNEVQYVVGAVAAVFGTRLLAALTNQITAFVKYNVVQRETSKLGIKVRASYLEKASAAVKEAEANLQAANAERVKIQAALAAEQQYYKGINTLNAYLQNTQKVRVASEQLAVAQNALTARMRTVSVVGRALNVALTPLRVTMAALGGPVGVIAVAGAAWWQYTEAQKQATEDAKQLADSQDDLKSKLSTLTLVQQKALLAKQEMAAMNLTEALDEEKGKLNQAARAVEYWQAQLKHSDVSIYSNEEATKKLEEAQRNYAIQAGVVNELEIKLAQVNENHAITQKNLADAVMGTTGALHAQSSQMEINIAQQEKLAKEIKTATDKTNQQLEVNKLKLAGNEEQAWLTQKAMNSLGKEYDANEKFIKDYIAGTVQSTESLSLAQKGIAEYIDANRKLYQSEQQLLEQKKQVKANKAAERFEQQWAQAYERVEARGATGLQRINLQQEAEIRAITEKAQRAKASEEELQNALTAINRKYDKQRADLADQYKPGVALVRSYQETNLEIQQLLDRGLLTEDQAYNARLDLQSKYYTKRAAMQSEINPAGQATDLQKAELAALELQYKTSLAMATGNEEQLTAIKENYERKRYQIQLKYAEKQALAQNQTALSYIESLSTMASSMTTIMAAAGDESSTMYKTMFAMSKAFSIAQATLSLSSALAQVLADPSALTPAQKLANYAQIAAAGASLVSAISSATLTGMAHDGISSVPSEGTWLLNKGERVLSPQQNADLTSFMRDQSQGGTSSGGNVTIQQSIIVQGNGDAALKQAMQQAARDGAEQGYNKVLQDFANRGSIRKLALG